MTTSCTVLDWIQVCTMDQLQSTFLDNWENLDLDEV